MASLIGAVLSLSSCADFTQKEIGSEVSLDGDTKVAEADKTIDDYSAKENLFIAAGVLSSAGSFRTETRGETSTVGISNAIASRRIVVGDTVFKESRSYSFFVKLGVQTYVKQNNYLIRDKKSMSSIDDVVWNDTVDSISAAEYESKYGMVQGGVCGYILNDDSITSANFVLADGDIYTFNYVLDNDIATYYMKREMAVSAGVKNLPVFDHIILTVKMDKNWYIRSIDYDAQYKVDKLGGVTCNEKLTETFYDIGKVSGIEESEFFEQFCVYGGETDDTDNSAYQGETESFDESGEDSESSLSDILGSLINTEEQMTFSVKIGGIEELDGTILSEFTAAYDNSLLYLSFGELKLSGEISEYYSALKDLVNIVENYIDVEVGGQNIEINSAEDVLNYVDKFEYVEDDTACKINLGLNIGKGLDIEVFLISEGDQIGLDYALASYSTFNFEIRGIEKVDLSGYTSVIDFTETYFNPIKELISEPVYDFEISGNVSEGEDSVDVCGRVLINVYGETYASGRLNVGGENIAADYLNGKIYAEYDGLKVQFLTESFKSMAEDIYKFITLPNVAKLYKGFDISYEELQNLGIKGDNYLKFIKSICYDSGNLVVDVDSSVLSIADGDIVVIISTSEDGKLKFDIDLFIGGKNFSISLIATQGSTFLPFDLSSEEEYMKVDDLAVLCKAFNATSESLTYRISGTAEITAIGLIERGVNVEVEVEVVDDIPYFIMTIERPYRILNSVYSDNGGITNIYYDGGNNLLFERKSYSRLGKLQSSEYRRCTMAEFSENPIEYIEFIFNFNVLIEIAIEDAADKGINEDAPIGDIIKGFSYSGSVFNFDIDLYPLDHNLGKLNIGIGHNDSYEFSSLSGAVYMLGELFEITFDFNLDLDLGLNVKNNVVAKF